MSWGCLRIFSGPQSYFDIFPHLQKRDPLPVNLGHGIIKLIFLKDAEQTGK